MCSSVTFVKVPVCLYDASTKNIRLYSAFLDFKAFNAEGFIENLFRRKADRFYYRYWRRKLIAKGWAIETRSGLSLVSYQQVWRDLDVQRTWNKKLRRFKFNYRKIHLESLPVERKQYFKHLQDLVQKIIASNVRRRIKWRLRNKQKEETETFLSCRTVARLFHLQSPSSGHKYRKKLFEVVPEELVRVPTEHGYRYKCKRILL